METIHKAGYSTVYTARKNPKNPSFGAKVKIIPELLETLEKGELVALKKHMPSLRALDKDVVLIPHFSQHSHHIKADEDGCYVKHLCFDAIKDGWYSRRNYAKYLKSPLKSLDDVCSIHYLLIGNGTIHGTILERAQSAIHNLRKKQSVPDMIKMINNPKQAAKQARLDRHRDIERFFLVNPESLDRARREGTGIDRIVEIILNINNPSLTKKKRVEKALIGWANRVVQRAERFTNKVENWALSRCAEPAALPAKRIAAETSEASREVEEMLKPHDSNRRGGFGF